VNDLEGYLAFACDTARAAAAAILPHFRVPLEIEDKGGARNYDPVTIADRGAETVIREAIHAAYPTHGLFGEEHGRVLGSAPWTWVIDPIDGTKSFILGQLHWGTLIALNDGTSPVVGVAFQPFVGEMFFAARGGAARWRRGDQERTLATRRCTSLAHAIVATTDPRHFISADEQAALAAISGGARFTRYGGDLYCYTQLAMGLVDIVIETGLKPYDVQALIPIIEAAGGTITNWEGGPCPEGGSVIACGDPSLHARLIERLQHL
jgi:myo-inositol-1(or 4)-monophosphatase